MSCRPAQLLLAAALAVIASPALAQLPGPPAETTTAGNTTPSWIRELVQRDRQCAAATNGCEVCRIDSGRLVGCSLPGIACQPASWACTRDAVDRGRPPSDPRR